MVLARRAYDGGSQDNNCQRRVDREGKIRGLRVKMCTVSDFTFQKNRPLLWEP